MSRRFVSTQGLKQRWSIPGILALIILVSDQISKLWIVLAIGPGATTQQVRLFGDLVSLVYVENTGVAFGLFPNMSQFFTVTSLLIGAGAIYAYLFYLPNHSVWVQTGMGLILGGALGNIIDRLRVGYVIDFLKIGWWPVFNIADSAITLGVSILVLYLLIVGDTKETKPEPPRDDALLRDLLGQELASGPETHRPISASAHKDKVDQRRI
ncbi:MAG: signal peptidase II [Chloroflexales bacterium]|nr:signal peptidase II [Chloroflexales bacterium]